MKIKRKILILPLLAMLVYIVLTSFHFKYENNELLSDYSTNRDTTAEAYSDITYGKMTDQDGNTYKTVTIGTQTWMAENLRTTKYNNGKAIRNVTNINKWEKLSTGAYSIYNNSNNVDTINTYGYLYNWHAVNTGLLAPEGWHVPTRAEWETLLQNIGGKEVAGGKLKVKGTTHWNRPNVGATNESGFSALPGGRRGNNGVFYKMGDRGFWWSTTKEKYLIWSLEVHNEIMNTGLVGAALEMGFSVRCVKD